MGICVYDILGCEASVLANERKNAGSHEFRFDGTKLASGVYFYRLQAGSFADEEAFAPPLTHRSS